jgi:hypothetical protein
MDGWGLSAYKPCQLPQSETVFQGFIQEMFYQQMFQSPFDCPDVVPYIICIHYTLVTLLRVFVLSDVDFVILVTLFLQSIHSSWVFEFHSSEEKLWNCLDLLFCIPRSVRTRLLLVGLIDCS